MGCERTCPAERYQKTNKVIVMQRLKLKRIKKKVDMPERRTVFFKELKLNNQTFSFTIEINGKVYITNDSNGKVYELINEVME